MKILEERFIKDFILDSDLIENLFFNEAKLLHNHPFNKDAGHFGAVKYIIQLAERKISLQESGIKKIHELIMEEQEIHTWIATKDIGKYRKINAEVKKRKEKNKLGKMEEYNITFPNFAQIPSRMENFVRKIWQWQVSIGKHCEEQNIEIIGRFHYDFEKIHPFADGNGRVGRLIALYMILFADLEPFIFTSADKEEEYYPAFEHKNKMALYFVKKYRENKERLKRKEEIKISCLKSPRQEGNI
jgi:Fic family protein